MGAFHLHWLLCGVAGERLGWRPQRWFIQGCVDRMEMTPKNATTYSRGKAPGSPPARALNTFHCHLRGDSIYANRHLYPASLLRIVDLFDFPYPFGHQARRATLGSSLGRPYWLKGEQSKHIRKAEKNMLTTNYRCKDRLCMGTGARGTHRCTHMHLDV